MLRTFTNPTPAVEDDFGFSVAAVGTDQVLIGAPYDDAGATNAGAAYLFRTNGTLLTTFTNPAPAYDDEFGITVAAVGTERVLIGAWSDDTGATNAGAAYLFSTSGALLTSFTNPTPAVGDYFGFSVAAVGTERVLIGVANDDTGAINAGAAYLFSLEITPSLSIRLDPHLATITISWSALAEGWVLERTNALPSVAAAIWPRVPPPYQTNAGTISVVLTNNPVTGNQFFRLHKL